MRSYMFIFFIFMLMSQMNSFCSDNELDSILDEALEQIQQEIIAYNDDKQRVLNNDAQGLNSNVESKKKRRHPKKKKNLNKEEVKELSKHFILSLPVRSKEQEERYTSSIQCPRINSHDTLIDNLLKYYFNKRNVPCINPCCEPTDLTRKKVYHLLKQHASMVKQSFTRQSKLSKQEEIYVKKQSDDFLTLFHQQKAFFVHQDRKQGVSSTPKNIISLDELPNDAILEHIRLNFDDNDADIYREPYQSIFKLYLEKCLNIVDMHFIEEYRYYNNNQ